MTASRSPNAERYMTGSRWITKRMLFGAGLAFVIIASMVYTVRGPMRAYEAPRDFLLIYSAAKAWLQGGNPYDRQDQYAAYLDSIDDQAKPLPSSVLDSLYPPTTFVMLTPISAMDLKAAHLTWIFVNSGLVIVGMLALLRVARIEWTNPRGLLLLGLFLIMGPVQSAVTYGHLSLAVLAGLTLSYLALLRGRALSAGLLLGLAVATKPQLAGVFLVALPLMGRWRTAAWAAVVVGIVAAIAIVRMHSAGAGDWFSGWMANVSEFTHANEPGDATWGAKLRWQLVNLAPVLHNFIDQRGIVQGLSIAFLAGSLGLITWIWHRRPTRPDILGLWSIMAVVTLLPVYHRYYDTCMLILPMVWAVRELRGKMHHWAVMTLSVLAIFIVPSSTAIHWAGVKGYFSESMTESFFWQAFVKLHQNYFLLALLLLLIWGLNRSARLAEERANYGETDR